MGFWANLRFRFVNFILCYCLATNPIFISPTYAIDTSGIKSGVKNADDSSDSQDDPDIGQSFKDGFQKDCAWGSKRDELLKDNSAETQKKNCVKKCDEDTDSPADEIAYCKKKCNSADYATSLTNCDSKEGAERTKCITTNAGSWLQGEGINTGSNGEIILSRDKQKKLRDIECAAEKIGWITQFLDLVTRDIDGNCPSAKLAQVGGLIGLADLGIMMFGDLKLRRLQYDYWKQTKEDQAGKTGDQLQKAALEYLQDELEELMKIDIAKMTSASLQTAIHAAATGVAAVETAMMFVPPNFGEGFACKVPVETTNGLLAAADLASVIAKGDNATKFAGTASGKKRTAGNKGGKGGKDGKGGDKGSGGSNTAGSGSGGSKPTPPPKGKERFRNVAQTVQTQGSVIKKFGKKDPVNPVTPPKKGGKVSFKNAASNVKTKVSIIKAFGKKDVDNPLSGSGSKNNTPSKTGSNVDGSSGSRQAIKGGIRGKLGNLWDRLRGKNKSDDVDILDSKNKSNVTAAGSGTRVASLEPGFVTVKKKGDVSVLDDDVVGNRRAVTKQDIETSWEGINADKSKRAKLQKELDDPNTSAARRAEIEKERAGLKSDKYGQENVLMDNSKKEFKIDKKNRKAKAELDKKMEDFPDDIKKQWSEVSDLMDPKKSKKMTAKEINEANQKMNKMAKDMRDQGLISDAEYNNFKKAYKKKRAATRLEAFKDAQANIDNLRKSLDDDGELDKKRAELEEQRQKKIKEKNELDEEDSGLAQKDKDLKNELDDVDKKLDDLSKQHTKLGDLNNKRNNLRTKEVVNELDLNKTSNQKVKAQMQDKLWKLREGKAQKALDDFNNKNRQAADLDEKIKQKKNELSNNDNEIKTKKDDFENDQKNLNSKKNNLKQELDDGVADYDAKIAKLREKMNSDAANLGDNKKKYEQLGVQKGKELGDIKNLKTEKIVLEAQNKQLNAVKNNLEAKNTKLRDLDAEFDGLNTKARDLDVEAANANQKFSETETTLNKNNKELQENYDSDITTRNKEIADLESDLRLDSGAGASSLRKNRDNLDGSEIADSSGNKKFDPDSFGDTDAFDQNLIKDMDADANNFVKANNELNALGDDIGVRGNNKSAGEIENELNKKNKVAKELQLELLENINEIKIKNSGLAIISDTKKQLNQKLTDINQKNADLEAEATKLSSERNEIKAKQNKLESELEEIDSLGSPKRSAADLEQLIKDEELANKIFDSRTGAIKKPFSKLSVEELEFVKKQTADNNQGKIDGYLKKKKEIKDLEAKIEKEIKKNSSEGRQNVKAMQAEIDKINRGTDASNDTFKIKRNSKGEKVTSLKKQLDEAKEFESKNAGIIEKRKNIQNQLDELKVEFDKIDNKFGDVKGEFFDQRLEQERIKSSIEEQSRVESEYLSEKKVLESKIRSDLEDNNFDSSVPGGGKKNYDFDPDDPVALQTLINKDVKDLELKNNQLKNKIADVESQRNAAKNAFDQKKQKIKDDLDNKISKADGDNIKNKEIQDKIEKLKKEKENIQQNFDKKLAENKQKLTDAENAKKVAVEDINKKKSVVNEDLDKVKTQKSELQAELRTRTSAADIEAEIALNNQKLNKIDSDIQVKNTEIANLRKQQTELAGNIKGRNAASIRDTDAEITRLEAEKKSFAESKNKNISDVDAEINAKKSDFDSSMKDLEGKKTVLSNEIGGLEADRSKLTAGLLGKEELETNLRNATNRRAELKLEIDQKVEDINTLKSNRKNIQGERAKIDNDINKIGKEDIGPEIEKLQKRKAELESDLDSNTTKRADLEKRKIEANSEAEILRIEKEIAELDAKTKNRTDKLLTLNNKYDIRAREFEFQKNDLEVEVKKKNQEIAEAELDIQKGFEERTKLMDQKNDLKNQRAIAAAEGNLDQVKKLDDQLTEVRTKQAEIETDYQQARKAYIEATGEKTRLIKKQGDLDKDILSLRKGDDPRTVSSLQKRQAEIDEKLANLDSSLNSSTIKNKVAEFESRMNQKTYNLKGKTIDYEQKLAKLEEELGVKRDNLTNARSATNRLSRSTSSKSLDYSKDFISKKKKLDDDFDENITNVNKRAEQDFKRDVQEYNKLKEAELLIAEKQRINDALEMRKKEMVNADEASNLYSKKMDLEKEIDDLAGEKNKIVDQFDEDMNKLLGEKDVIEAQGGDLSKINDKINTRRQKLSQDLSSVDENIKLKSKEVGDIDGRIRKLSPDRTRKFTKKGTSKGGLTQGEIDVYNKLLEEKKAMSGRSADTDAKIAALKKRKAELDPEIQKTKELIDNLEKWDKKRTNYKANKALQKEYDLALSNKKKLETQKTNVETEIDDIDKQLRDLGAQRNASLADIEAKKAEIQKKLDFLNGNGGKKRNISSDSKNDFEGTINDKEFGSDVVEMKRNATDFEDAKNKLRNMEDEFGVKNKTELEDKVGTSKQDADDFEQSIKTDLDRLEYLKKQKALLERKNNADSFEADLRKRDQDLKDKMSKLDGDLTRKRNFDDAEFSDPDFDPNSVQKMKGAQDKYFKAKELTGKLENEFDVNKSLDSNGRSKEVNDNINNKSKLEKDNAKEVQSQLDKLDNTNKKVAAKEDFEKQNIEFNNKKSKLDNENAKLQKEKGNIEDKINNGKKTSGQLGDDIKNKDSEIADLDEQIRKLEEDASKPRDKTGKILSQDKINKLNNIKKPKDFKDLNKYFTAENFWQSSSKNKYFSDLGKKRAGRLKRIDYEDIKDAFKNDKDLLGPDKKNAFATEINKYKDSLPNSMKQEFEMRIERVRNAGIGSKATEADLLEINKIYAVGKARHEIGAVSYSLDAKSAADLDSLIKKRKDALKNKLDLMDKKEGVDFANSKLDEKLADNKAKIEKNQDDVKNHETTKPQDPSPDKSLKDLFVEKNKLAGDIKTKLDGNKWGKDSFGSKADYSDFDPDNPVATKNKIGSDVNDYDNVVTKTKGDYNNAFKDKEIARSDFAKARQDLKNGIQGKIAKNAADLDGFKNKNKINDLDPTLDLDKIDAERSAIVGRVKNKVDNNKVGVGGKKADLVFDEDNIGKLRKDLGSNVDDFKADLDNKLSKYNDLENTKNRTQKEFNTSRDKLKEEYQKRLANLDDQNSKLNLDDNQADLLARKKELQDRLNNDINPKLSEIDLEDIRQRVVRNNVDDPNFKSDMDDDTLSKNLGGKNDGDRGFFDQLKKDNADLFKDDNFDMNDIRNKYVGKQDFELTGKIKDLLDNKKKDLDKLAKEKSGIDPEIDRLSNLNDVDTSDIDKKLAYFDKKLKDGDFWDGQKRLANIDDDYMYFKKGTGEDDGVIGRGLERFNKGKIWDIEPSDGAVKKLFKNVGNEVLSLNFLNRAKRVLKTNPEDGFIKRGAKFVARELLFGMVNYNKFFKDRSTQRGVASKPVKVEKVEKEVVVDCSINPNDASCVSDNDICTTSPDSKECICSRNPDDTICLGDQNNNQEDPEEPEDLVVEKTEPECPKCFLLDDEIERLKREIRTNRSLSREESAEKQARIRLLNKKRNELWKQAIEENRKNNNPDQVFKVNTQHADEMMAKLDRVIKEKEKLRAKFLRVFPGYKLYEKLSQSYSLMQSLNTVEKINSMEDVIFADIEKRNLMSGKIKSPRIDHYQFMKKGKFFSSQDKSLGVVQRALSYSRELPEVAVDIVFPKSHAFIDKLITPFMDQWQAEQGREWEDSSDDRSFDDMMAEEKGKMVVTTAVTIGVTMVLKKLVEKIPVAKGIRMKLSTSPGILFLEALETTVAGLNLSHAAIEYQALDDNKKKLDKLMNRYSELASVKSTGGDDSTGSSGGSNTMYINQSPTGGKGAAGDVNRTGMKNVNCYSSKSGQAVMDSSCACKASNSCHQMDLTSVLNTPMANNKIDAQQVAALQKSMNEYLKGTSDVQNGNLDSVSGNLRLATHFKRKADKMVRALNRAAKKQGSKAPDISLGKQLGFMDQMINKTMPSNWAKAWNGGGGSSVAETRPPLALPDEAKDINNSVQQVVASPSSSSRGAASLRPAAKKPKFDFEIAGKDDKVDYMDKKWNVGAKDVMSKNQINNRKSTSIWTVISHRYRKTGVKVLFDESTQSK